MGLFGGTTIVVSSSVYNMAGDINKRPNYLKTIVGSSIIGDDKFDLTETFTQSYMTGPGVKARNFCRWAINHYQGIGIPTVNLGFQGSVSYDTIQSYIPVDSGQTASLVDFKSDSADLTYWVEQWLMVNNAAKLADTWTVVNNSDGTATITYSDLTTDSFTLTDFDPIRKYFYVIYNLHDSGGASLGSRIWIYMLGSGHEDLDSMLRVTHDYDNTFFPVIPIRIEDNFLSDTYMPQVYDLAAKAYKKATTQKFSKLVTQLKTSADIDKMNYIYVTYGCSLNTIENASKKYIFKLFEQLCTRSTVTTQTFSAWQDELATWQTSGGTYPMQPYNQIEIKQSGELLPSHYHVIISWSGLSSSMHTGVGKVGALPGDCWIVAGNSWDDGSVSINGSDYSQGSSETIQICMQVDANTWKRITAINLQHENLIYKDKSVITKAVDALASVEESEFIIPLSYEIQREMSIVDATQMQMSCLYIVINSYKKYKKKWYQTTFFMIIVVVAIVAIAIATGGIGAGTAGLLGTAGAVGAAVGLTGLAAVIVGTLINMLAAMILTKLIGMLSVAVFGPKLGAIIGAIVSVIAIAAGTGLMNGQSLSSVFGNLTSAHGLISLTESVGNGVTAYLQAAVQGVEGKIKKVGDEYHKDSKEIEDKYLHDIGAGLFAFDPLGLTDFGQDETSSSISTLNPETMDQFLQRTLMTGTDIAELSKDMLHNFADITLDTSTMFGGS